MAHHLAPQAATDLDDLWLYVAKESGNLEIADRLIDSIIDRFYFLSTFPYIGRSREREFGAGMRSLPVGEYIIVYCVEGKNVSILGVAHGRRNFENLLDF